MKRRRNVDEREREGEGGVWCKDGRRNGKHAKLIDFPGEKLKVFLSAFLNEVFGFSVKKEVISVDLTSRKTSRLGEKRKG